MSTETPLLITVAPTGAETCKQTHPQLPTTPREILDTARSCEQAGAGLIHVHLRDDEHRSTLNLERAREVVGLLRAETSLVVQISTGGSVHDSFDDRLAVLEAGAESCSLSMGTLNFGGEVFLNPWGFIVDLYQGTQELGIVPEFELFDLGQVHALGRLISEHGRPAGGRIHADIVMNVPGGVPGTPAALLAAVQCLTQEVDSWSATGIGRATIPVALAALSLGGHLRVGMEDVLTFAPGRPVQHNRELVERAAGLGRLAQRPPMDGAGARQLLNVKPAV
jgi:uncharacterized protein (DUF849 family)